MVKHLTQGSLPANVPNPNLRKSQGAPLAPQRRTTMRYTLLQLRVTQQRQRRYRTLQQRTRRTLQLLHPNTP